MYLVFFLVILMDVIGVVSTVWNTYLANSYIRYMWGLTFVQFSCFCKHTFVILIINSVLLVMVKIKNQQLEIPLFLYAASMSF